MIGAQKGENGFSGARKSTAGRLRKTGRASRRRQLRNRTEKDARLTVSIRASNHEEHRTRQPPGGRLARQAGRKTFFIAADCCISPHIPRTFLPKTHSANVRDSEERLAQASDNKLLDRRIRCMTQREFSTAAPNRDSGESDAFSRTTETTICQTLQNSPPRRFTPGRTYATDGAGACKSRSDNIV